MEHVERPATVGALHVKLAVEGGQLEVDVLDAEQPNQLVAEVLGSDREGLERKLGLENYGREMVMVGLRAPLRVCGPGLVVVVERTHEILPHTPLAHVLCVSVSPLSE